MIGSKCCFQIVNFSHNTRAVAHAQVSRVLSGIMTRLHYSKDNSGKCCENTPQSQGKKVEEWPKSVDRTHAPWRCECPDEPQPCNYDPYRIKVPDIAVPPLPPSNAKGIDAAQFKCPDLNIECNMKSDHLCQLIANTQLVHPDYWKERPTSKLADVVNEVLPKLGYHGRTKYKYAFHEPWRPLDRVTLMEQAEKEELPEESETPKLEEGKDVVT